MLKLAIKNKPVRILIADDDELFLHIVENIIQKEGFSVITARSGSEALRAAKETQPDLIILDSNMPSMSGEEVCRQLKNDDLLKSIPVIIFSGLEDESSLKRFVNSGCDDYIPKSKIFSNLSVLLMERIEKALKTL